MNKKTIVITGCSTGFGRITALELARRSWHVFATVRNESDQASLLAEADTLGCNDNMTVLLGDITLSEQIGAMAQQVEECLRTDAQESTIPRLNALLNNAGTAFGGPLELLPLDDLRAQLEINTIAPVGVIQAFLPMLKAAQGTIINVSSVGGRVANPVTGAYAASKFALEAISDVLRIELAPFDVHVVVIEPTSSPTNIWNTSLGRSQASIEQHRSGPYARLLNVTEKVAKHSATVGFPPQLFADTVVQILQSRKPHARYVVPRSALRIILLRRFLPDRLWDRLVRRMLKW